MVKKLFVKVDMFSFNQDIFLADDENIKHIASVPIDRLSETLYALADAQQIESIDIQGENEFIQKIGYEVLEGLKNNYSNENVRITLNGEVFNK